MKVTIFLCTFKFCDIYESIPKINSQFKTAFPIDVPFIERYVEEFSLFHSLGPLSPMTV